MVTVGQLMKQDLVTVDAATLVIDAAKLMKACNVGSVLVSKKERIVGDFTTVVGFPLRLVAGMMARAGITVSVDIEALYATKPYGNWDRFPG
jgi:predicted house-cleaning NTP pyrophosphatase (Maf/HAM1 superfamily)